MNPAPPAAPAPSPDGLMPENSHSPVDINAQLNAAFASHNQALYHFLRMLAIHQGMHPEAYSSRLVHEQQHHQRPPATAI